MRTIAMAISYIGTAYYGFQTQPDGNTIQDRLEKAIAVLTGEQIKVHGSGRTDSGVHARRQIIHFHTASIIPIERWCMVLNPLLPKDIVTNEAYEMPHDFHARRSAVRKTYCYMINTARHPDVFRRELQLHYPRKLNIAAMEQALAWILGTHDFTSFCNVRSEKLCNVRTIYQAQMDKENEYIRGDVVYPGLITITITGSGFLYNMVRIVVGTLLEIGVGNRKPEEMPFILEAKDRSRAGPTASTQGLMLWNVQYAQDIKTYKKTLDSI
jgi:tRNA pseudouridine38-40 synthase